MGHAKRRSAPSGLTAMQPANCKIVYSRSLVVWKYTRRTNHKLPTVPNAVLPTLPENAVFPRIPAGWVGVGGGGGGGGVDEGHMQAMVGCCG